MKEGLSCALLPVGKQLDMYYQENTVQQSFAHITSPERLLESSLFVVAGTRVMR